jgi:hypothetical protein
MVKANKDIEEAGFVSVKFRNKAGDDYDIYHMRTGEYTDENGKEIKFEDVRNKTEKGDIVVKRAIDSVTGLLSTPKGY